MRLRTPARRPAPPRRAARTAVRVAAVGAVAASAVLATLPAQAEVPPAVTAAPASVVPESVAPAAVASAGLRLGLGDPYFPTYGNRGYDVRHYSIDDSYQPGSGALRGRTRLRAVATKRLPKIKLDLVLVPGAVRVDGRPAAFRQRSGHELVITPRRPIAAGRQFRVKVTYHGTPGQITRGRLSPWVSDAGEGLAVGEPQIGAWWFAANDHPRDKATYDITVRVPKGRQAISNGVLVSRRDHGRSTVWHWRMAEPMATYLAFFAAGSFRTEHGTADGLPYVYAVSKGLPRAAQRVSLRLLRRTPQSSTGWRGSSARTRSRRWAGWSRGSTPASPSRPRPGRSYPYLSGDADGRSIVVHELAHQWFGDTVSVRPLARHLAQRGLRDVGEVRVDRPGLVLEGEPRVEPRDHPARRLEQVPAELPRQPVHDLRGPAQQPQRHPLRRARQALGHRVHEDGNMPVRARSARSGASPSATATRCLAVVAPGRRTPLLIACRPFGTRTVMSYVALSRGWSLANARRQTARPSPRR